MLELNAIYFHRPIVHGMRDYKPTPACEHTHTILPLCHVKAMLFEVSLNICGNKSNMGRIEIKICLSLF